MDKLIESLTELKQTVANFITNSEPDPVKLNTAVTIVNDINNMLTQASTPQATAE